MNLDSTTCHDLSSFERGVGFPIGALATTVPLFDLSARHGLRPKLFVTRNLVALLFGSRIRRRDIHFVVFRPCLVLGRWRASVPGVWSSQQGLVAFCSCLHPTAPSRQRRPKAHRAGSWVARRPILLLAVALLAGARGLQNARGLQGARRAAWLAGALAASLPGCLAAWLLGRPTAATLVRQAADRHHGQRPSAAPPQAFLRAMTFS